MNKIEKEEAEKGEKALNEYFAKFDKRYRENVALGLQDKDALPYMSEYDGERPLMGAPRSNDHQREFLAMYNPDVAMDMVTPTAKQIAIQNVTMYMLNELFWREEIDAQMRQQLEQEMPEVIKQAEKETRDMDEKKREEHINQRTQNFTDKYAKYMVNKDTLSGWFRANVDRLRLIMQPDVQQALDKLGKFGKFDAVKEFEKENFVKSEGVEDFSKVSLDGPRDLVGETIEMLNKGVVYDTSFTRNEELEEKLNKIDSDTAQRLGLPIVNATEGNYAILNNHLARKEAEIAKFAENELYFEYLQNNFELAKSLEEINAELRKDVAGQSLKALEDLSMVRERRDHLSRVIEGHHRETVEDHSVKNGRIFDFIKFQEDLSKRESQTDEQRRIKQLLELRQK